MHKSLIGARARSRRLGITLALTAVAGLAVTACQPVDGAPSGGLPTALPSASDAAPPVPTDPGTKPETPADPGPATPSDGKGPDLSNYNISTDAQKSQTYNFGKASGRYGFDKLGEAFTPDNINNGAITNGEWQKYSNPFDADTHYMADNELQLRALVTGGSKIKYEGEPKWYANLKSGKLTTKRTFKPTGNQVYVFQISAKMPTGKSSWPAFWTYRSAKGSETPDEIDILEFFGSTTKYTGYDHGGKNSKPTSGSMVQGGKEIAEIEVKKDGKAIDFSAGYHTFTLIWKANGIEKWVDDQLVKKSGFTWTDSAPANVILNLAVGGSPFDGRQPDSEPVSAFPSKYTFSIQYLKLLEGTDPGNER